MGAELILLHSALTDGAAKSYAWTLDTHGLEMGVGRAGVYEEHAHRHYVDLIFCPTGLRISPLGPSGQLVLVEPRVRFGPVRTGVFFFMKFLPVAGPHTIPDKVIGARLDNMTSVPAPALLVAPQSRRLSYFDPRNELMETLDLCLAGKVLDVRSSVGWHLQVAGDHAHVPRFR